MSMELSKVIWTFGIILFSTVVYSGPRVRIDTLDIDFDTVSEITSRVLTHTFSIKNIGDSTLDIYRVWVDCGCTKFKIDSVIPPGKIGRLTVQVNLSDLRDGAFGKYLRFSTNDPQYPRGQFTLSGVLRSLIYSEDGAIVLPTINDKDTVQTVPVFTDKSDLKITGVTFVVKDSPMEWQSKIPVRFQFKKTGKKNSAGHWIYELKVFYFPVKESIYGDFVVTTNHPDKPKFKIPGFANPRK